MAYLLVKGENGRWRMVSELNRVIEFVLIDIFERTPRQDGE